MLKSVLAAAIAGAFLTAASLAPASAATNDKSVQKRTPTAAQAALRDRQRKCGAEWRAAKAAGKIEQGMKWPQYWSACNKRLKQ